MIAIGQSQIPGTVGTKEFEERLIACLGQTMPLEKVYFVVGREGYTGRGMREGIDRRDEVEGRSEGLKGGVVFRGN